MILIFWKKPTARIFDSRYLVHASGATNQALISEALESDSFSFELITNASEPGLSEEIMSEWRYGQEILLQETPDGFNTKTIGKFFVSNVAHQGFTRDGRGRIRVECLSFVGLLVEMTHVGGVYSNAKAGAVIAEILQATEVTAQSTTQKRVFDTAAGTRYTIDSNVYNARIDGHLPYADGTNRTARDNLRDVLFSCGASVLKDAAGDIHFTYNIPDRPSAIPDTKIYAGDRYGKSETVTAVSVVEHSFVGAEPDAITLFDASALGGSTATVIFDEPVKTLDIPTGMTVLEWGANYAVVRGSGILRGYRYKHSRLIHTEQIASGAQRVKTADVRTVSSYNYAAVMRRLANYYSTAKEIHARLVLNSDIKTGALVSFNDPTNKPETGYIKSNAFNISNTNAGDAVIVAGWVPLDEGTGFDSTETLTGSGTWSKATAEAKLGRPIKSMRIVLIGGGFGGDPGIDGEDGHGGETDSEGGNGGIGGAGGLGGLVLDVDVLNVPNSISFSCGAGGLPGMPGGATTVTVNNTTYSSNNGAHPLNGAYNTISGAVAAVSGQPGESGAAGWGASNPAPVDGFPVTFNGVTYAGGKGRKGLAGTYNRITSRRDGSSGIEYTFGPANVATAHAGGGGGAAVGNNGGDSTGTPELSEFKVTRETRTAIGRVVAVDGGPGANAIDRTETPALGEGGFGGHGGGGGGGGGKAEGGGGNYYSGGFREVIATHIHGVGGIGGKGGKGSRGGAGLIWLIY